MRRFFLTIILLMGGLNGVAFAVECPAGCVPREQAAELSPDADPYACPTGCVWYSDIIRRVGEKEPEPAPVIETPPAPALEPGQSPATPDAPQQSETPVVAPAPAAPVSQPHAPTIETQTPVEAAEPPAPPDPPIVAMQEKEKSSVEPEGKVPYIQSRRDTLPDTSRIAATRYRNVYSPTGYGLKKGVSVLMVNEFWVIDYQYGVTDNIQIGVTAPMPYFVLGAFPSIRGHGRLSEHHFLSGGLFGGGAACSHEESCAVLLGGGHLMWTGVFNRSSFTLGAIALSGAYYDYEALEWNQGWKPIGSLILIPKAGFRWEARADTSMNIEVSPLLELPFHIEDGERTETPVVVTSGFSHVWGTFIFEYGVMMVGVVGSKSLLPVIPVPYLNLGGVF
jgi:hypothetical protein